ncbi:recombination regulator RecX [Paralcaligenes sp. KSB-10]|jgi:regulatory protein|uniref:recombination regulator RecX n=1 Tax=Paralcaligenes sp. KSB-10 TaxID=2901142 RepID=UPI001E394D9D|nr:recombination regulator RecX [Paralcaligenes sp. KSB-10]UHL65049.1 recombination regulator RecX [Paralcaligenes sp. KSB-10]
MPDKFDNDDSFEQLASSGSKKKTSGLSLKARAVGFLSRREHSRLELERKLAAHTDDPAELQRVLDELEREQWLSNERFAQALMHRKAARQGTALIMQELKRHGLADEQVSALRTSLQSTEVERARGVWAKKFSQAPQNAKEYARQFRFLASRGFSANCLRQILGDQDDDSSV